MTTLNLFSNRATAKLAADVIAGDTALTLVTGEGARFPALAAGQYFRLVLQKGTGPTDQREYMVCTARAGDVLTVTRAQEGTAAAAFAINDEVSLVATALSMTAFVQRSGVTMQGALEVEAPPTTPLGIATKAYVDTGTLTDAPSDGAYYVRRNAAWVDGDSAFATDTAVAGKVAKAGDTMSGALGLADGAMAAPGLNFASEPATGLYRASTGTLAWAVAGTQVAALGAATSASTYISMNPRAAGSAFFQLVNAPYNATNYNSVSFGLDTTHAFFNATAGGSNTAKPFDFIGAASYTFNPSVYVTGAVSASAGFYLTGGAITNWVQDATNVYLQMAPSWFWQYIKADGRLIWNTASGKTTVFENNGGFTAAGALVSHNAQGPTLFYDGSNGNYLRMGSGGNVGTTWSWQWNRTSGALSWLNNVNTSIFSMDAVGGVYAAVSLNAPTVNISGAVAVQFTGAQLTKYVALGDPGIGSNFEIAIMHNPGVWAGIRFVAGSGQYQLDNVGQPRATIPGSWAALLSDARVKERIKDYTEGLDALLALRVREFSFREGTGMDTAKRHIGLIAQESGPLKQKATISKMGDIELDDPLTYDNQPLSWQVINAIKTLHHRVTDLEQQ